MSEHKIFDEYPEVYENYDFIIKCSDRTVTYQIIKSIFDTASVNIKERIIRAFCNIRSRDIGKNIQKNPQNQKAGADTILSSSLNSRVYTFFAFIDTCHDYAEDISDLEEIINILQYTDDTIPIPNNLDRKLLTHPYERELITWLVKTQYFIFTKTKKKKENIANPLYKKSDIMQQFDIHNAVAKKPDITYEELFSKQQHYFRGKMGSSASLVPIDIFSIKASVPVQYLKLEQIAELCYTMRNFYGENCNFQIDRTDDHLVILITHLHHISNVLYDIIVSDNHGIIISNRDINEKLKHAITRKKANGELIETIWKVEVSDANFFDAASTNNALHIDYSSITGPIYKSTMPYQIDLNGIDSITKILNVNITDINKKVYSLQLTNKETNRFLSKTAIRLLIGSSSFAAAKPATAATALSSAQSLPATLPTLPTLQQTLASLSPETLYAIKRAGDWGQVQHCVKYNKIFVTSDKFAALYAHYSKVRYIYLRRTEYFNFTKTLPDFIRYTFILSK